MIVLAGVVLVLLVAALLQALLSGRLRGRDGSELSRTGQPRGFWLALAILLFCAGIAVRQLVRSPAHRMAMPLVQPTPVQQADRAQ